MLHLPGRDRLTGAEVRAEFVPAEGEGCSSLAYTWPVPAVQQVRHWSERLLKIFLLCSLYVRRTKSQHVCEVFLNVGFIKVALCFVSITVPRFLV